MQPCPEHRPGETYAERVQARPWAALYQTQRWRRLSARVRREEPLCRECKAEGLPPSPTRHTDHIVPHKGDLTLFWSRSNLQGICVSHHSKKTRRGE